MKRIIINSNTNRNKYLSISQTNNCQCVQCDGCISCIVFAPIVGLFLGPTLSVGLTINKDSN